MAYTKTAQYTHAQIEDAILRDLLADAESSERQAAKGPFFPATEITRDNLLAYAAECRAKIKAIMEQ